MPTIDLTGATPPPLAGLDIFASESLFANVPGGGIPSGQAFGTLKIGPVPYIAPAGISSGEAFGTAVVRQTVVATGIASGEAFGTATVVSAGSVFPTGIPSSEAFGTPALKWNLFINPPSIPSGEAFGNPGTGFKIAPTGIPSAEAFGYKRLSVKTGAWKLVNPSRVDRYRLGEPWHVQHVTNVVAFTVLGNDSGLQTIEMPTAEQVQSSKYVWPGGHANITTDIAIRNLWLANGFDVEMSFSGV